MFKLKKGISKLETQFNQAVRTHAPPVALILLSAPLEKYLAFTTKGTWGSLPLPVTLKYP